MLRYLVIVVKVHRHILNDIGNWNALLLYMFWYLPVIESARQ